MSKSNYPEKIDTSVELPLVRDNITELNSEIINGLTRAIIQIERTLGINPQGSSGSTVATRVSKALDDNGNIKKEALTQANVLSGPISDVDVSKVAAIRESKLKLDFPTKLLQSEVSILGNQLNDLITQLEQLNAELSVHIHPDAKNRHKAVAITVESAIVQDSSVATLSLEDGTAQVILEKIYNAHMNYTGDNISETNASHRAEQIFFDKETVSDVIFGDDVQTAIVDLADLQSAGLRNSALNLNSNGRVRSGSTTDGFADNSVGKLLLESSSVTYAQAGGESRTTFTLTSPVEPWGAVSEFDILTLSNATTEGDNKEYQVASVTLSGDSVASVEVYGGPFGEPESGLSIMITKPLYGAYNRNGLNSVVRPRNNRTNTPDVIVANPDAATIVSFGIIPGLITSDVSSFDLTVDDRDAVTIEAYDSGQSTQTFDTIVNRINEQFVDLHIPALSFKVRVGACYELALTHMVPNFTGDVKNRTLKISAASTTDATNELGFTNILDTVYQGATGNKVHINGYLLTDFGKLLSFDSSDVEIVKESSNIGLFSGTFEILGVRIGDTLVITNSEDATDDGAYRIRDVDGDTVTVDYDDGTFGGSMESTSAVYIIRNSAVVDELTFTEAVSATGSILFDIFMDQDKDINYKKRMEIDGALTSGSFTGAIVDISKGFIAGGEVGEVSVGTDGFAYITGPDSQVGPSIFVGATGTYKVRSADTLQFIVLEVNASANPTSMIAVDLYGFDEVADHNYIISRGLFGTSLGIILGTSSVVGIPVLRDKRVSGTMDHTIVSEPMLEKYIEGPRNELRASGIISGLGVSAVTDGGTYYTFDVSAGVAIVNGIRYEFPGVIGYRSNFIDSFYIAFDESGCIVAGEEITNPGGADTSAVQTNVSPFHARNVAHIGYVDSADDSLTDLRFFVSRLDYKMANHIIVSKEQDHGHFTNLNDAVNYLRLFTGIFNTLGTPKILIGPGEFEHSSQIVIDFDLLIEGSGPSTVLRKTSGSTLATGKVPSGSNIFMSRALFLVGTDEDTASSRIESGVTFRNFTYESNGLGNVGIVIAITQDLGTSPSAVFRVENVNFEGPTTMDGSVADASKIGEYAVYMGQQNPTTASPESNLTMGNLIFRGNYLNKMGLGNGAVYFTESSSSTFKDIVVVGNIGHDLSPNVANTSVTILEVPTTPTSTRFVETGNAVSD